MWWALTIDPYALASDELLTALRLPTAGCPFNEPSCLSQGAHTRTQTVT